MRPFTILPIKFNYLNYSFPFIFLVFKITQCLCMYNSISTYTCSMLYNVIHVCILSFVFCLCSRVRQNVRFLISLADFTIADIKGLIRSKDLINSTKIIHQLPWDRKYLLKIAKDQLKSKYLTCIEYNTCTCVYVNLCTYLYM